MRIIERIKRMPAMARFYRWLYPWESTCLCCCLPWSVGRPHFIDVNEQEGFFPVCEHCHRTKSYDQNQAAVIELHDKWERECDHGSPYQLADMLVAFDKDWKDTHPDYGKEESHR